MLTVPLAATTPSTAWTTNGRPRHVPVLEDVALLLLLDDPHLEPLPGERGDAGGELAAEPAGRREEEDDLGAPAAKTVERGHGRAHLRALLGELEGDARAEAEREDADLAVEREDEQREDDDRGREDDEGDGDQRVGGGRDVDPAAEGGQRGEGGEADGAEEEVRRPALGGAEAPAPEPLDAAEARLGERRDEADAEEDRRVRARGQRQPPDQQDADDRLDRHDRPGGRAGVARREAVGGKPVGKVLAPAQLGRCGPEQEQSDEDPGDRRQRDHCRS